MVLIPRFREVAAHILANSDPAGFNELYRRGTDQVKFSIGRLSQDLIRMGFSSDYALRTATQIAPKPILYSLLVRWRTQPNPDQPLEEIYVQVAPEFTAYLFDQIIDGYNIGYQETNAVQSLTDQATQQLAVEPNFYQAQLDRLLSLCFDGVSSPVPRELEAFSLLAPYINYLRQLGQGRSTIRDVLCSIGDALTNGHLSYLAYHWRHLRFRRYSDFVDDTLNIHSLVHDDAAYTFARSMLRGQGFLMVAASQYALSCADVSLRVLIRNNTSLVDFIRNMEILVRLYDDVGDLETDRATKAPNIILADDNVKHKFISLAGLESEQAIVKSLFARDAAILFANLVAFEQRLVAEMSVNSETAQIVELIANIVYGSRINGIYNDETAEAMGEDTLQDRF